MSYAVVRGEPEPAQIYLDTLLDEVLADLRTKKLNDTITSREQVTFTQLLYHHLEKHPDSVFMINGATDEEITNKELKDNATQIARVLTARNAKGKIAVCAMKKDQNMAKIYYGLIFAGVVPFMIDVMISELIEHFLKLLDPAYIFYDSDRHEALTAALHSTGVTPEMVQVDGPEHILNFIRGHDGDCDSFQLASVSVDDTIIMVTTSGSTGVPKLAPVTHRRTVSQLPILWSHYTQFPPVNQKVLILSTVEWMSFHFSFLSAPIYNLSILMTPKSGTMDHIKDMIEKHRPTAMMILPAFGTALLNTMRAEALTQFELFVTVGAVINDDFFTTIAEKLPKSATVVDMYGTTETAGIIAAHTRDPAAPSRLLKIINMVEYKIIDSKGKKVGPNETGELLVKSVSIIKTYDKNDDACKENFTADGWYKTGDLFQSHENEMITFVGRKNLACDLEGGLMLYPEEVERIVCLVPGVTAAVVHMTSAGPAAAVVALPGVSVSRELVKQAVDSCVDIHKRLHGGVAFVPSLPLTRTGKLNRSECNKMIEQLVQNGQCF